MASKGGVIVVVSGEDKTGELFKSINKHMDEMQAAAKKTSESMGNIGKTLMNGLQAAGIAIGVQQIGGYLKEMVTSTMEAGVQLGHLSQQTGISVQNLSVLKYAAQQTGVNFEVLTRGFKKLAVTTYDADDGNKKAAKGFSQLGISVEQLRAKGDDMYGVLTMLADKFHAMPDGIAKSDAAAKIFGVRMGAEMIPILDELGGKLDAIKAEAEALGLVWDKAGIAKMEEMHKSVVKVQGSLQALGITMTTALAPAIELVSGKLVELFAHDNFQAGIDGINQWADDTVHALARVGYAMGTSALDPRGNIKSFDQMYPGAGVSTAVQSKAWGLNSQAGNNGRLSQLLSDGGIDFSKLPKATRPLGGDDGDGTAKGKPAQAVPTPDPMSTLYAPFAHDQIQAWKKRTEGDLKDATDDIKAKAAQEWNQMTSPDLKGLDDIFPKEKMPSVVLAKDYSAVAGEAEKYAHGIFDPLFNFSEKWSQQWKQMRANMLRDLGETAESKLFGALFGDPEGRGGKGWNGGSFEGNTAKPGRSGIAGATGLVGQLLGSFGKKRDSATSNGGLGGGAGTIASAAASVMQMGKGAAAGAAAIHVVINNTGTPQDVTKTQQSGGADPESMVLSIFTKDLATNGPMSAGILGLIGL